MSAADNAPRPSSSAAVPATTVKVWQQHYKRCRHVVLTPAVEPGQSYRVVVFLDIGDWCPACKPLHQRKKAT